MMRIAVKKFWCYTIDVSVWVTHEGHSIGNIPILDRLAALGHDFLHE